MLGQKGYSYLGLAKRGGKLITGACLLTAIQQKTVYLVLTSNDVGSAQAKKYQQKCFYYNIPYFSCLDFNLTQQALGTNNVKMIGISDQHLAQRLLTLLNNS
ncbi:putative ribosomal protein l7ae [Spiroplasma melliferum IPMB4A]|uniref:Ribosomal protein l7ae n=2 Tax=Spiroplasma melliferum TaxID=2134 RepID=A0AAI9T3P0_SPIME|nr:putative ribosomal protein l7ae [Spiroplasma melliferum IPMB4A]KAI92672.1 ribosomal protein l7ae [Spiroplasma melliferum KC3]